LDEPEAAQGQRGNDSSWVCRGADAVGLGSSDRSRKGVSGGGTWAKADADCPGATKQSLSNLLWGLARISPDHSLVGDDWDLTGSCPPSASLNEGAAAALQAKAGSQQEASSRGLGEVRRRFVRHAAEAFLKLGMGHVRPPVGSAASFVEPERHRHRVSADKGGDVDRSRLTEPLRSPAPPTSSPLSDEQEDSEKFLSTCSWSLARLGYEPDSGWVESWCRMVGWKGRQGSSREAEASGTQLLGSSQAISNCLWALAVWQRRRGGTNWTRSFPGTSQTTEAWISGTIRELVMRWGEKGVRAGAGAVFRPWSVRI
jgi:hypothetical protein